MNILWISLIQFHVSCNSICIQSMSDIFYIRCEIKTCKIIKFKIIILRNSPQLYFNCRHLLFVTLYILYRKFVNNQILSRSSNNVKLFSCVEKNRLDENHESFLFECCCECVSLQGEINTWKLNDYESY